MMYTLRYLCCVFALVVQSQQQTSKRLVLTQMVFRHGDRAPSHIYPTDPNSDIQTLWPRGLKQLTTLGMEQAKKLGEFVKKKYSDQNKIISSGYKRNEIYVRSSDKDRALETAQAFIRGLYASTATDWATIVPVHSFSPTSEDTLLKPSSTDCPEYERIFKETSDQLFHALDVEHKDLYDFLKNKSGLSKVDTADGIPDLFTAVYREKQHNLSQPLWVGQMWKQTNKTVYNFIVEIKRLGEMAEVNTPEKSRLRAGVLLGRLIQNMNDKLNNNSNKTAYIYSSHSGTVMPLLFALNVSDSQLVPYTGTLMVDLWWNGGGTTASDYSVRLYFYDGNGNERRLKTPGCAHGVTCSFDKFIDALRGMYYLTDKEREAACNPSKTASHTSSRFSAVLVILSLFLTHASRII